VTVYSKRQALLTQLGLTLSLSFHHLLLDSDLLKFFSAHYFSDCTMTGASGPEQEPDPIVGLLNGLLTSAMIELTLFGWFIQYQWYLPSLLT
jgi:hypothetical protein